VYLGIRARDRGDEVESDREPPIAGVGDLARLITDLLERRLPVLEELPRWPTRRRGAIADAAAKRQAVHEYYEQVSMSRGR